MNPVMIQKTVKIAAPPAKVWEFIGTAAGLSQWWGVDITMEERDRGHFTEAGQYDGHPYRKAGEVLTYDPPRKLSIRLHSMDSDSSWPSGSEVDITLAEDPQADGALYTTVSVVHRAISGEADALSAENFTPIQPSMDDAYGPNMMIPQSGGLANNPSLTSVGQVMSTETFTLQELYQWRYQQEQTWQSRFVMLATLSR